jgi:hypothetical protein
MGTAALPLDDIWLSALLRSLICIKFDGRTDVDRRTAGTLQPLDLNQIALNFLTIVNRVCTVSRHPGNTAIVDQNGSESLSACIRKQGRRT